jgi:hypothetical protein
MSEAIAWLVLIGIPSFIIYSIAVTVRERRKRAPERAAAERKVWAHDTRRLARQRARIAYPELLDAQEADEPPRLEFLPEDVERIRLACDLVKKEIEGLPKSEGMERLDLEKEQKILSDAHLYSRAGYLEPPPYYGLPSEHLNSPARIIDCGEAGKIELFTPEQAEDARRESEFDRYIDAIQRCHDGAPNVARGVIERAKERERLKQEAVDAITTKVDDLPPLPSDRQ